MLMLPRNRPSMDKPISRRDFLNGIAVTSAMAVLAPGEAPAETSPGAYTPGATAGSYPPLLNGIRGSHDGSYEVAHQLAWRGIRPQSYRDTGEEYDLVIVGAGISGLAAAYFYQQNSSPRQRILILDNHDDFGGHARRNEFLHEGRMLLGFGGSINLEHPENYSPVAKALLNELGTDMARLERALPPDYNFASLGGVSGLYVKSGQQFGAAMLTGRWMQAFHASGDYRDLIEQLPFDALEKGRLVDLIEGKTNLLGGMSLAEKLNYLKTTSYHAFLRDRAGLSDASIALFDPLLRVSNGVGGDSLCVADALAQASPGLRSMGYLGKLSHSLLFDEEQPYRALFFPDGNASIARLLVRRLIPAAATGRGMDDILASRFDYAQLDRASAAVRLRLSATVVNVVHRGKGSVDIEYVESGAACSVRAGRAILACDNGIIPHLAPELPEAQKEALSYGVKTPFIWVNVLLRNGAPFFAAGAEFYTCPGSYFELVSRAPPASFADFDAPAQPHGPLVVFMAHSPAPLNSGKDTARDLYRRGRQSLYTTPFATYEREIRQQLSAMFGAHGFDADRDIEAITVNRWPHGYAYNYNSLYDPEWKPGTAPHELGRQRYGRISIANSDSEAMAYVDAAIDAAWRAAKEQLLG
ncbi:twin-arginine translocation pathway signal [gamma proteobacterium NOR5-3]|nr:twin-arginine translocation pathway signal [gamma proteobacterium NOR5-3]